MLPSANFNTNILQAIPPGIIKDNAAFTANVIDLAAEAVRGAQFLTFVVQLGSIDADMAVLRVMESDTKTNDTTLGGSPAAVVNVLTTVTPGASDDNKLYLVTVDLRATRERYLQLQATAGDGAAGTYLSALCFAVCPASVQTNNNAAAKVAA
jgi:hypothetical protein